MVKEGNCRVIATLSPRTQANLIYIIEQFGLKNSSAISLAINNYAEIVRKEKR